MRVTIAREEMRLPERKKKPVLDFSGATNGYYKRPLSFFTLLTTLFATHSE